MSKAVSAVASVVTAPVQAVAAVAAPVVDVAKKAAEIAVVNPAKGALTTAKGVVAGDWQAAGRGIFQTTTSMNPLSQAEQAIGRSPTGFGAVGSGNYSSAEFNRALAISSVAAGYGAAGAGGALVGSKLASGDLRGAAMSAAGQAFSDVRLEGVDDLKNFYANAKPYVSESLKYAQSLGGGGQDATAFTGAGLGVTQDSSGGAIPPILLVGIAVGAFLIFRKKRKTS